ncbi:MULTISPECIES: acyl carrier protein [unclassified Streptomyces]|uniref:acyl carrier protein n=1 Tax=unclassified Streptomyces TaxID=2593676 RepID=UPI0027426F0D|nr:MULTISPECIES: acyl carrier protein [unclassified Streptomyces]
MATTPPAALRSKTELKLWLTALIADYVDADPTSLDPHRPLAEAGLDSVYAVSVCADIEETLGIPVEPTLAWDHPTIDAIAEYLHHALALR